MIQLIALLSFIAICLSMHIPEDTEILDGYNIEKSPEISPEDIYFEARSLVSQDFASPIRNKRSPKYVVVESPGLKSHFRQSYLKMDAKPLRNAKRSMDYDDFILNDRSSESIKNDQNIDKIRNRRDTDPASQSINTKINTENEESEAELLPNAEKQIMEPEARSQSVIVDRWTKSPFEYAKVQKEEDSLAEASISEGISARTPRVNFVTQQKKNSDSTNLNDQLDQKASSTKAEIYKNLPEQQDDRYYRRQYEELPVHRNNDDYMMRNDRYDRDDFYDSYRPYDYQRSIDFADRYMPRRPKYPDAYYDYPDSRYDLPEPRDYRPIYSNDINERYPSMYPSSGRYIPPPVPNRNRRIIYYATLPEIVRTPNDYKYKPYNQYDGRYNPYGDYNSDYSGYRPNNKFSSAPNMGALKDDRDLKKVAKPSYQRSPVKVLNSVTVKDDHSRPSTVYGGRPNDYNYQYY